MKQKRIPLPLIIYYAGLFFLLAGYILLPMLNTVAKAFHFGEGFTLSVLWDYLQNANNLRVLQNTATLGFLSVLTCGLIGTLLALYLRFVELRWKRLLHIILLTPMMIPGVIIVIAFIELYGESGILTNALRLLLRLDHPPFYLSGLPGILFVITYTQYVYFYLNVSVALKYVDRSAIDAAVSLGAGRFRIFRDAVLPVIRPALITSAMVTFVSGIGSFSAPNLIGGGYKVLSTQIVRSKANNRIDVASVQVLLLLLIGLSVMFVLQICRKRAGYVRNVRATSYLPAKKRTLFTVVAGLLIFLQVLLILVPVLGIIYMSFNSTHSIMTDIFPHELTLENYAALYESDRVLRPIKNSLNMSLLSVAAGLALTVPVSYLCWKRKDLPAGWARAVMMLPWCLPGSVIGINLINAFNKKSVFAFGQSLIGGYWILPIAYVILSLPLLLSYNDTAMESFNPALDQASHSLGASSLTTMLRLILPGIAPGIAAGGILAFIRTVGEYTVSALLYGVYNRPISISMVLNIHDFNIGISMSYGVLVIAICFLALLLLLKLDKKQFL